jgi:8-amino-7-oxononanoate synthase
MKINDCLKNWECSRWSRMPSEFQNSLLSELEGGLRRLESKSQRRSLLQVAGVNLCSNDYLGLSQSAELRDATAEAVRRAEHVGGTGSRLLSGHFAAWEEVESEFAAFAGTEAALYFGSGYAANLGLITSLLGREDLVFSDALNHASIIDAIRLTGARKVVYPHRDLSALETALLGHATERCRKIVVTESVFSMDGDVADVSAIVALAERFGASVIVDEAHATAVHGPRGRGIVAATGNTKNILAVLHTCGKALASAGAFVCGNRVLKEHLINHARTFIFSTAMPPYMAAQIGTALRLARGMDVERRELLGAAAQFSGALRNAGWDTSSTSSQIVPAIVGSNEEALDAAECLQTEGFAVRAIRPPTVPEGKSRLRFSLTSLVPRDELRRMQSSLNEWRSRKEVHAAAGRA